MGRGHTVATGHPHRLPHDTLSVHPWVSTIALSSTPLPQSSRRPLLAQVPFVCPGWSRAVLQGPGV